MRIRLAVPVSAASLAGELPYGRDIAVETFLEALGRHGAAGRYLLLATDEDPSTEARLEALEHSSRVDFRILPMPRLFDQMDDFEIEAWHDPDADLTSAARLRNSFAKSLYPVTATAHVLSYQGLLHGWIVRLLLADVRPCDALVCTSVSMQAALANLLSRVGEAIGHRFRGELPVIPYPIDTERFKPRDRKAARRALGLDEDATTVLWIGRLSPVEKADLTPLIRAFARVARREAASASGADLRLLVAGWGEPEDVAALHRAAQDHGCSDRVDFLGLINPSVRHLVYAASDLFVSPADNLQETFGITPLEALASGVPQIVSDWNGYRDLVVDGETGFLVPTYWGGFDDEECRRAGLFDDGRLEDHHRLAQTVTVDLEILERALIALVAHPALRQRMSSASRRRALETFSEAVVMDQYASLWRDLGRVAATLPREPERASYDRPAFLRDFGHYATRILDDDDVVEVTRDGLRAIDGSARLAVDPRLRLSASRLVGLLESATRRRTLAELDHGTADGRRHLLWLLKHGLLRRRPP